MSTVDDILTLYIGHDSDVPTQITDPLTEGLPHVFCEEVHVPVYLEAISAKLRLPLLMHTYYFELVTPFYIRN